MGILKDSTCHIVQCMLHSGVPSSHNIKQTWLMVELTIFLPWLIREGFNNKPKVAWELLTVHFMPDRSAAGGRKCHNRSGKIPSCSPPGGPLELPSHGSLKCTRHTFQLPKIWSWRLWTISQKGWMLFSLFCILKYYCHFLSNGKSLPLLLRDERTHVFSRGPACTQT